MVFLVEALILLWIGLCAYVMYRLVVKSRIFNRTVASLASDDDAVIERLTVAETALEVAADRAEEVAEKQTKLAKSIRSRVRPSKRKQNEIQS